MCSQNLKDGAPILLAIVGGTKEPRCCDVGGEMDI